MMTTNAKLSQWFIYIYKPVEPNFIGELANHRLAHAHAHLLEYEKHFKEIEV